MFDKISESIGCLAGELRQLRKLKEDEFEWFRSHAGLATKQDLETLGNNIMATQNELVVDLKTANAQLRKLITDTAEIQPSVDALKAKIAELEVLVAAGGTIGQELVDTVAETKALVQTVDDNVPELPASPVA